MKKLKQLIHLWLIDKMIESVDRELIDSIADTELYEELSDLHTALSLYYCRVYRAAERIEDGR